MIINFNLKTTFQASKMIQTDHNGGPHNTCTTTFEVLWMIQ